jgi:hypothetical protein
MGTGSVATGCGPGSRHSGGRTRCRSRLEHESRRGRWSRYRRAPNRTDRTDRSWRGTLGRGTAGGRSLPTCMRCPYRHASPGHGPAGAMDAASFGATAEVVLTASTGPAATGRTGRPEPVPPADEPRIALIVIGAPLTRTGVSMVGRRAGQPQVRGQQRRPSPERSTPRGHAASDGERTSGLRYQTGDRPSGSSSRTVVTATLLLARCYAPDASRLRPDRCDLS